ncbi:MAG: carbohydrate ABC transporter permease [Chloroflexota bacterium]|jgi:multiple sugar transport system permease protein|nr:carbohydrate ABC transporter permease [Chloroflexota bacterium]
MSVQTGSMGRIRFRRPSAGRIVAWIVLGLLIIITLFPFWWIVRTSLSNPRQLFVDTTSMLPARFTLNNYARVLGMMSTSEAVAAGGSGQTINFLLYLRNSLIVTTSLVIGQISFSALAAYAFARLNFPLRDKIFTLYIAALMIPAVVMLIPNFVLIRTLGWLNTFQGIIAPAFLMTPFSVFFFRQFFLGINREIEESAKLDGASLFGIFIKIVVPMSVPPITTLAILAFLSHWNDYLWPLLIGKDESVRVLTVALGIFRTQTPQGAPDFAGLMAGAVVSMVPTLLLYFLAGRKAIDSIQFSGIK